MVGWEIDSSAALFSQETVPSAETVLSGSAAESAYCAALRVAAIFVTSRQRGLLLQVPQLLPPLSQTVQMVSAQPAESSPQALLAARRFLHGLLNVIRKIAEAEQTRQRH